MDKDAPNKKWLPSSSAVAAFFRARFFEEHFARISLIFLIVLMIIFISLLRIADADVQTSWLHTLDTGFTDFLVSQRNQTVLQFFYKVTLIAEAIVIIPAAIVFGILLVLEKKYLSFFVVGCTLAISHSLTALAKLHFMRPRPSGVIPTIIEHSFAYPSGHATAAMAFYGSIAYLYVHSQQSRLVKTFMVALCAAIIILVDLSRIYLGVHYLSDVFVGNLVGLLVLLFSLSITKWLWQAKVPMQNTITLRPFIVTVIATSVYIALVVVLSASPFIE